MYIYIHIYIYIYTYVFFLQMRPWASPTVAATLAEEVAEIARLVVPHGQRRAIGGGMDLVDLR